MLAFDSCPRNAAADCSVTTLTQMSMMSSAMPASRARIGRVTLTSGFSPQQGGPGDRRRRRPLSGDLRRLPRRRIDRRVRRVSRARRTATSSRRGAAPTPTRSAICRATAAPATGTATAGSPTSKPTATSPRSSSRTRCRRSSPPACSSPVRRPAPPTSIAAGPGCAPTTDGWPTGAPNIRPSGRCRPGVPQRRRPGGRRGPLGSRRRTPRRHPHPGRPRRHRHRAALLADLRPVVADVRGARAGRQPSLGQRPSRLRRPLGLAVHVGDRDRVVRPPSVLATAHERRVRPVPDAAFRAHRAGLRVAAVDAADARRDAPRGVERSDGRAEDGSRRQPGDGSERVLRPQRVGRRELPRSARGPGHEAARARPGDVGQRLSPPRGQRAVLP